MCRMSYFNFLMSFLSQPLRVDVPYEKFLLIQYLIDHTLRDVYYYCFHVLKMMLSEHNFFLATLPHQKMSFVRPVTRIGNI